MNFVLSNQRNASSNVDAGPAQEAYEMDQLLQTPNMLPTTAQFILGESGDPRVMTSSRGLSGVMG